MVCLLGDAGHPVGHAQPQTGAKANMMQMMPHQSQGACMAIEDAAALGILFSPKYFSDIDEAFAIYEHIRLPRVSRVQSAAAKAAYNINERIGKSCCALREDRQSSMNCQGFHSIRTPRRIRLKTTRNC